MNNYKIHSLLFLMLTSPLTAASQTVEYPLDPMTWSEHWTVLEVLRDNGHLDGDTRFSMVNLREPAKQSVLEWKQGQTFSRQAFALVRQQKQTFEAVIDLDKREVGERIAGTANWLQMPSL